MVTSINHSPIIFILGAGASVPLGMPTTKNLRTKVCDRTRIGRIAAALYRSAAYRFRISEDNVNIEDFLEHLYELQLMLWVAQRSRLPQLLPRLTGAQAAVPSAAWESFARVQRRVFETLHRTCGDCSGRDVERLWGPILEFVDTRQSVIPIFTLNYDWTFEKLAIENMKSYHLIDGFDLMGGTWDPSRFEASLVRRKINLKLFKLHGSTNWLPGGPLKSLGAFCTNDTDGSDGFPSYQFDMIYPGHAYEMWLGKEAWQRLSDTSGIFGPRIEDEPYQTLQRHLHQAARRAAVIVVIGYAFHDTRVNAAIFGALAANKRRRLLVVDPGVERYVRRTNTTHQEPPFEWLKYTLQDVPWSRVKWVEAKFGEPMVTSALLKNLIRFGRAT